MLELLLVVLLLSFCIFCPVELHVNIQDGALETADWLSLIYALAVCTIVVHYLSLPYRVTTDHYDIVDGREGEI